MTVKKLRSKTRPAAAAKSSATDKVVTWTRSKMTNDEKIKSLFTPSAKRDRYGSFAADRLKPVPGVISCDLFARQLNQRAGVDSLLKEASVIWQHELVDEMHVLPTIPDDVEALGAQLCSRKGRKLKALENIIEDRLKVRDAVYRL
jgi:hypothetical protein